MADSVATLYVEIDADDAKKMAITLASFSRQSEKTEKQNKKLNKSNVSLGKSFQTMKGQLSGLNAAIGALTVGAGLTAAVKSFAELDKGLIGIRKTTGIAGDELAKLGEEIQEIGTRLPVATGELLGIAEAAGQLGVTGSDAILAFTETVGMLGTASNLAGEDAAVALARILNLTGEAAEEVDVLGSVIVSLGNNFATNEKQIASLSTEIAQATSVFEISSAEVAALAATMSSLGVRAELGGSAVGRVFRTIEASINAGGESLQRLSVLTGMTGNQIRQTFATDAVSVFQAFTSGIGRIVKQGGSAADTLATFGLKGEEILKVLPSLATNSGLFEKALNLAAKETKNATALTNEALAAAESFSAQMTIVGNVANRAAADIGRELAPAILDVVNDFAAWTSANREFLRDDVGGGIREIVSAITSTSDFVQSLPDWVVGTGGAGLVGWALFGPYGAALLTLISSTGSAVKSLQDAVQIDTNGELDWTERFSLWVADLENGTNLLDEINNKSPFRGQVTQGGPHADSRVDARNEAIRATLEAQDKYEKDLEAQKAKRAEDAKNAEIARLVAAAAARKKFLAGVDTGEEFGPSIEDFENREKAAADIQDKIDQLTLSSFNYQRVVLNKEVQAFREAGVAKSDIARYYAAESARIAEEETDHRIEEAKKAQVGAEKALKDYAESAMDVQSQIESATTNALMGMEDALVDFVRTGKIEFSDLVDSIIADLARMAIRSAITGPIVSALGSALGSGLGGMFGSTARANVPITGGTPVSSFSATAANAPQFAVKHSGGMVGFGGASRSADPSIFSGAQRFHNGGFPGLRRNEVPTILERGERVLSRSEVRNGAGSGKVQVIINNAPQEPQVTTSQTGDVQKIFIEFDRRMANAVGAGSSQLAKAMAGAYGLTRQGKMV